MNRFVLNYLGVFFLLLSILAFFNIIYSYYFNLYLNVNTYFYTLLISLIVGIVSFIKKKDCDEEKTKIFLTSNTGIYKKKTNKNFSWVIFTPNSWKIRNL